MLLHSKKN
ncbi:UNVERIFIED_CONTAM: hypothetical protein GTU68_038672 [Idotea baltica]|nr:hypothetical protein [Idotea baltica]